MLAWVIKHIGHILLTHGIKKKKNPNDLLIIEFSALIIGVLNDHKP